MRKLFLLLVMISGSLSALAQPDKFKKKFPVVDKYIDSFMKEWNIPGLALGIVYKDQLIYAKGYGYRDLENNLPVDANTVFPIASNTKLFTATAACMLALEGKLDLNKPARNYLPSLKFNNSELDANVTVRDMLSHRTGLPRYDGIWAGASASRKDMVTDIAYMKPQLGFREGYIYNNMMYVASGAVMEKVTGSSWENLVRNMILDPLQMKSTGFTDEDMKKSGNFSYSYFEPDSTKRLLKRSFNAQTPALGPAGTIKSNLTDMSHWMIAQLNHGKWEGRQVIPDAAIQQTLVPNAIADKEGRWDELSNAIYALARNIQTYKGYKIATHTGSIDGFYSNLTFLQSEEIAIFMVHNSDPAGSVRNMMAFPVIDRLLGLQPTPWSGRYMSDYKKAKEDLNKQKDSLAHTQVRNTSPSHSSEHYKGVYRNAVYGDISIEQEGQQLYITFRSLRSLLQHFHYDQFFTEDPGTDKPSLRLHFSTDTKGRISSITMRVFGDPPAEFSKQGI